MFRECVSIEYIYFVYIVYISSWNFDEIILKVTKGF